jgi:hypothetical protein
LLVQQSDRDRHGGSTDTAPHFQIFEELQVLPLMIPGLNTIMSQCRPGIAGVGFSARAGYRKV